MTGHPAVVEVGPGTVRRLCCGTSDAADPDVVTAALGAVDDQVALVGERPVSVDSLWRAALRSVTCAPATGMVVVHPSWWPSSRVGRVTAAAAAVTGEVVARPRSWLLTRASPGGPEATVVVEIADRLVAISRAEIVAVPRTSELHAVAEEVTDSIAGSAAGTQPTVVLVDAPGTVTGAAALAELVAGAARRRGHTVVDVGNAQMTGLARAAPSTHGGPYTRHQTAAGVGARSRARRFGGLAAAAVALAVAVPGAATLGRRAAPPGRGLPTHVQVASTTFLVEGRVALEVPANWSTQRVLGGPGSARVQVTSPTDPEVALHLTQSPVGGETLNGTGERLRRSIDTEPAGVFVDFNPSGTTAGRLAVTYREVRVGHHVRWTVWPDGPVRISIGCQSRPGDEDAVRAVCDQAVRSAHAIG